MTARPAFTHPLLPLDGIDPVDRVPKTAAVEGETLPSSSEAIGQNKTPSSSEAIGQQKSTQYHRLFGQLTPAQVMLSVQPNTLRVDGTDGSPVAHCDPAHPASHPLFDFLAMAGHPSAAALASIASLRERHLSKGLTPQNDAQHGSSWWWHGIHKFWWKAMDARQDHTARRKALIGAAALIVARIDALDFLTQQEAATNE